MVWLLLIWFVILIVLGLGYFVIQRRYRKIVQMTFPNMTRQDRLIRNWRIKDYWLESSVSAIYWHYLKLVLNGFALLSAGGFLSAGLGMSLVTQYQAFLLLMGFVFYLGIAFWLLVGFSVLISGLRIYPKRRVLKNYLSAHSDNRLKMVVLPERMTRFIIIWHGAGVIFAWLTVAILVIMMKV